VGQLAWIVEKFQAWTDPRELPEEAVDRDQLLADVTLYWLTGTARSSAALYYETAHAGDGWAAVAGRPSETPAGVGGVPRRHLPARSPSGGAKRPDRALVGAGARRHFPAMEVPDLLARRHPGLLPPAPLSARSPARLPARRGGA
jgi:epoxide hydrolase